MGPTCDVTAWPAVPSRAAIWSVHTMTKQGSMRDRLSTFSRKGEAMSTSFFHLSLFVTYHWTFRNFQSMKFGYLDGCTNKSTTCFSPNLSDLIIVFCLPLVYQKGAFWRSRGPTVQGRRPPPEKRGRGRISPARFAISTRRHD